VPIAKAPGGLYHATVSVESCDGGFKASVTRVILMTTRSPVGTEVEHDPFPEFVAESKEKAERRAAAYFKAWAKVKTLRS
jgi:hypothetical protein